MKNEFSTFDIVKTLGIPKGRLREWIVADFVQPTVPAEGPGTKAVFTRDDVYLVEFFRFLVSRGFRREEAAWCLKALNEKSEFRPQELWRVLVKYKEGAAIVIGMGEDTSKHRVFLDVNTSFVLAVPEDLKEKGGSTIEAISGYNKQLPEKFGEPKYWDAIMIYNFEEIRRKVDIALSALE